MKIDPVAVLAPAEDFGLYQGGEFTLKTGGAHAEMPGQVAQIPPLVRMQQGGSKDGLARPGKEAVERLLCTHSA